MLPPILGQCASYFAYPNMQNVDGRDAAIRNHDKLICALAKRISRADSDDLAQEGRIAMLRALETFDPTRGVELWTYAKRFVLGAMLRFLAVEAKEPHGDDVDDLVASIASPEDNAEEAIIHTEERAAQRERLMKGLAALTDEEREIIFLRFFEMKSSRAVAEQLGISKGDESRKAKSAMATLKERAA